MTFIIIKRPRFWRSITALALLICAFVWMRFSQSAYIMAKVAIGEGGVLHSAGTIRATYNANAMEYEVYQGKARYSSGFTMEELLLLAKGKHDQEHFDFDTVLLGRERIFFPNGLLYLKWPFGVLPMTCLGRVSCAKALEVYSLNISQVSGTNRFALSFFESDDSHQEIIFEIPNDLWRSIPQNTTYEAHSNNVDIVLAARMQIGVTTNYVADYRKIGYPNGDIPRGEGVCSDVVVRALRDARKIDLQELMRLDMSANFSQYPRKRKWEENALFGFQMSGHFRLPMLKRNKQTCRR